MLFAATSDSQLSKTEISSIKLNSETIPVYQLRYNGNNALMFATYQDKMLVFSSTYILFKDDQQDTEATAIASDLLSGKKRWQASFGLEERAAEKTPVRQRIVVSARLLGFGYQRLMPSFAGVHFEMSNDGWHSFLALNDESASVDASFDFTPVWNLSLIHISPEDFANISSIFFVSYLIFQIPSSIGLQKLGARKWISAIIVGWRTVTTLIFFAKDTQHILLARVFLGIFEAGFFPGMVYYLACWFPAGERGKVNSFFMLSIAVASVLAAPMSGWIIEHMNTGNYEGWRWLFAIEGIPTVLLGALTFYLLPDRPEKARWLTPVSYTHLLPPIKRW